MQPLIATVITLALFIRAYSHNSLTPLGLLAAGATAVIHTVYPSPVPFTLLIVFFVLGTGATKVKHDIKATLTLSSTGSSGGEGARNATQVFANSGIASVLILYHLWLYGFQGYSAQEAGICFGGGKDVKKDLILLGIMANYAAVTADTLSSELGILSKSPPRFIITPWKIVPPGTNGGVTMAGLLSGVAGSAIIGLVGVTLTTFCHWRNSAFPAVVGFQRPKEWDLQSKGGLVILVTLLGTLGTLLDSFLGAILQASVVDKRTGKVVEGEGGVKVLTSAKRRSSISVLDKDKGKIGDSRKINTGRDILDNNGINILMALLTTVVGIACGVYLESTSKYLSRGGGRIV